MIILSAFHCSLFGKPHSLIITSFIHYQASIHQTSFNDENQGDWNLQDDGGENRIVSDNNYYLSTLDGGLADELRRQQREEEPMDWDEIDSSLLDEINRLRETKRETNGEENTNQGSVLSLTHSNNQDLR